MSETKVDETKPSETKPSETKPSETKPKKMVARALAISELQCSQILSLLTTTLARAMVKHLTSQDEILTGGRSECRKGLSRSVKLVGKYSCQTMIFKASVQKGATEFSKER